MSSISSCDLTILQRSCQTQYEHVTRLITRLEEQGGRVLWLSDTDLSRARSRQDRRRPDLWINMLHVHHLQIALLITELIARELVKVIILEGTPNHFENHYTRLRWICAHFESKLIILTD